jgi:hypothetical protein
MRSLSRRRSSDLNNMYMKGDSGVNMAAHNLDD